MTPEQARELLEQTLREVVPDAEFGSLTDDADLRQHYELDSLDFVQVVERLSGRAGFRIDEEDYGALRTMTTAIGLLVARSGDLPVPS